MKKIINKPNSFFYKKWLTVIFGLFIYSVGYNLFLLENNLVAGDIEGIATIFQDYISPPLLILILSICLQIAAFIFLDKEKAMGSLIGTMLFPLFVYLTSGIADFIIIEGNDLMLASVFGGLLSGFGAGLAFKMNSNTGGTDILQQIMSKYFKITLGKAKIIVDGLIVIFGGFVFGWQMVLYSIICIAIFGIVTDRVMLGISSTKALYIISDKQEEVKDYLLNKASRGLTIISAKGGFSDKEQNIIMCLIKNKQYFTVKEELELIDRNAFLIVTDAYQSLGGK